MRQCPTIFIGDGDIVHIPLSGSGNPQIAHTDSFAQSILDLFAVNYSGFQSYEGQ